MRLKSPGPWSAPTTLLVVGLGAFVAFLLALASASAAQSSGKSLARHPGLLDDSLRLTPAADLALDPAAQRKADALTNFVEGARLEESGEIEAALEAYQKVLTVDP